MYRILIDWNRKRGRKREGEKEIKRQRNVKS